MIVLASQSPRRIALLKLITPVSRIVVQPPLRDEEPSFEGVTDEDEIVALLKTTAEQKGTAVLQEILEENHPVIEGLLSADTIVVATEPDSETTCRVLLKPPAEEWQSVVRDWFLTYYAGRSHRVMTAVTLTRTDGSQTTSVTSTTVHFRADIESDLDWYLTTDEPIGKAGGYAIQERASLFVERVAGSLTNVIGLPLEALIQIDREHGRLLSRS